MRRQICRAEVWDLRISRDAIGLSSFIVLACYTDAVMSKNSDELGVRFVQRFKAAARGKTRFVTR